MLTNIEKIELQKKVYQKFESIFSQGNFKERMKCEKKSDQSPVTEIDLFISKEVKGLLKNKNFHFFSEEDQESFSFPCAVVDPIDGTRELVRGIGEIAFSLALMKNDREGWAWIFNPFTGFSLSSDELFVSPPAFPEKKILGFVSRSEWEKGFFLKTQNDEFEVFPRGSIAFKLSLLASGACDFVFTRRPKNVWDIAAGTLLLWQRGFRLYDRENEILSLDKKIYGPNLLWCRPEHFLVLKKLMAPEAF